MKFLKFIILFSFSTALAMEEPLVNFLDQDSEPLGKVIKSVFVQSQSSPCEKNGIYVFSLVSGSLGCIVFGDLGYQFARKYVGRVAGPINGAIGAAPIAIMGTGFVNHIVTEIVKMVKGNKDFESRSRVLQERDCEARSIYASKGITILASLISGAPLTYLTGKFWKPKIGWPSLVFTIPTFYVKSIADYWALTSVGGIGYRMVKGVTVRNLFNPDSTLFLRQNLIDRAETAAGVIKNLSDEEAQKLIEETNIDGDTEPQDALNKLLNLISPERVLTGVEREPGSVIRKGFNFFGALVGAVSMAAMEPLGVEAVQSTLSYVGISDPSGSIAKSFSWVATVAAGSLMSYSTGDTFGKLYDALVSIPSFCRERCHGIGSNISVGEALSSRVALASYAAIWAALSSTPRAELSIDYLGTDTAFDRFALFCSAVAPFALDFWAIDEMFLSLKNINDPRGLLLWKLSSAKELVGSLNRASLEFLRGNLNRRD